MAARKSRGNATLTYNSNNITAYCKQLDLDAAIERLETTNLASSAKTTIAGDPEWSIAWSGDWDNAFDAIIGVDAVTPGTARTHGGDCLRRYGCNDHLYLDN